LTWEENRALDSGDQQKSYGKGSAHARIELQLLGDEVANYRTYVKIPDDWRRQQGELTLPRVMLSIVLPFLVLGGLAVTVAIVFLKNLRSAEARSIPWRRIGGWALWGLVAYVMLFAFGDRIANFMNAYQTAIPFKTMLAGITIGAVLGAAVYFAVIVLVFGMAWYFAKRAFAEEQLPGWSGMPSAYYRDALWIGLGGAAALVGLSRLVAVAAVHWPTAHRGIEASFGGDFDASLPAASIFGTVLIRALMVTGLVGLGASFVAAFIKQPWLRVLLFFGLALALVGSNWGTPADFAKQFVAAAIPLGVFVFGVSRVVRFNILGYFLIAAVLGLAAGAAKLISQLDGFYRGNGYVVLVMLAALLAWPLVAARGRASGARV
jgi:hypothetical protein